MTARKRPRTGAAAESRVRSELLALVKGALEDMKAVNVRVLDVRELTDIADCMIIASGNSDRHVRSIAELVVQRAKQGGYRPFGTEGSRDGEWVLVDLQDVLVHVMLPRVREFYGLEALWEAPPRAPRAPSSVKKPRKRASTAAAPRRRRKSGAASAGS